MLHYCYQAIFNHQEMETINPDYVFSKDHARIFQRCLVDTVMRKHNFLSYFFDEYNFKLNANSFFRNQARIVQHNLTGITMGEKSVNKSFCYDQQNCILYVSDELPFKCVYELNADDPLVTFVLSESPWPTILMLPQPDREPMNVLEKENMPTFRPPKSTNSLPMIA